MIQPHHYPGFLSFGSAEKCTLISPSKPRDARGAGESPLNFPTSR